jgi:hypothetical protein
MNKALKFVALAEANLMTSFAAAAPNPATDARIDPRSAPSWPRRTRTALPSRNYRSPSLRTSWRHPWRKHSNLNGSRLSRRSHQ